MPRRWQISHGLCEIDDSLRWALITASLIRLSTQNSRRHFAIVILGTPTRGTSLTVIWKRR